MDLSDYPEDIQELFRETVRLRRAGDVAVVPKSAELLDAARILGDERMHAYASYLRGDALFTYTNDDDAAISLMLDALDLAQRAGEQTLLGRCYNFLSNDASLRNDLALGFEYLYEALDCCRDPQDRDAFELAGIVHYNIAYLYGQLHEFEKALPYNRDAETYFARARQEVDEGPGFLVTCTLMDGYYEIQLGNIEHARGSVEAVFELERQCGSEVPFEDRLALYDLEILIAHADGDEVQVRSFVDAYLDDLRANGISVRLMEDACRVVATLLDLGMVGDATEALRLMRPSADAITIKRVRLMYLGEVVRCAQAAGDRKVSLEGALDYYELLEQINVEERRNTLRAMRTVQEIHDLQTREREMLKENLRLTEEAEHDQLTGLPNRYALNKATDEAFERAWKAQRPLGLEVLDIDFFKEYNDTYGHQAGDDILHSVAGAIRGFCDRHEGLSCGRWGGDEFVILYEGRSDDEILELAKELKASIDELGIRHEGSKVSDHVTVSQGIRNSVPDELNRSWDYFSAADFALYAVKRGGKNGIALVNRAHVEAGDRTQLRTVGISYEKASEAAATGLTDPKAKRG